MVRDLTTGECVRPEEEKPCADGFHRDETTGLCVLDEDKPCADGFYKNDLGLCVPDEEDPCDEGYHREGDVCVPDECPEGYIRNLETGLCEKVEDKGCLPGQVKNAEGKCVPIVKPPPPPPPPPPPKTCPPGYKLVNGVCVLIPTFTPSTSVYTGGETNEPIYAGGMDEFNLLATLQELLADEAPKKDDKKLKDKTKMATGGHLDDLLAEQITVDDLLKLLR